MFCNGLHLSTSNKENDDDDDDDDDECTAYSHSFPFIGPISWSHSGPIHHALSLSSSSLWTSHAACAIAIAGVRLATPGDWQCNGGSHLVNGPNIFQMLLVSNFTPIPDLVRKPIRHRCHHHQSGVEDRFTHQRTWSWTLASSSVLCANTTFLKMFHTIQIKTPN